MPNNEWATYTGIIKDELTISSVITKCSFTVDLTALGIALRGWVVACLISDVLCQCLSAKRLESLISFLFPFQQTFRRARGAASTLPLGLPDVCAAGRRLRRRRPALRPRPRRRCPRAVGGDALGGASGTDGHIRCCCDNKSNHFWWLLAGTATCSEGFVK